jgi:cobalt-zinc-cadmium efflux system outer membrane protein
MRMCCSITPIRRTLWVTLLSTMVGCQLPALARIPASVAHNPPPPSAPVPDNAQLASWQPPHASAELGVQPTSYVQPVVLVAPPIENLDAPPAELLPEAPNEFTLEELEEIALATNPSLAEAQAGINAARGRWVQVGLPPNTVLGYSGQQIGSHGEAEQHGVLIGQQFVRGHKLQLNREVADQEILIAERQLETQRHRVLSDVRLGYYEVLVAQKRLELAEQVVGVAESALKTSTALERAKEVSRADVLRAQIELQSVGLVVKTAHNQRAAAWSRLTAVLGTPELPPTKLAGDVEAVQLDLSYSEVLEQILQNSPELHAALFNVEKSRWAVARSCAEAKPNLDVQGVVQYDNSTGSNNGILQVTMPIPWLNRNQGGIREAQANLAASQFGVSRVELSLQRRLAAVFQRYATARNQVQDYNAAGGILENSRTNLDFVRRAFEAGEMGSLDYLMVQRTYMQANLAYVEAIGELWAASVEMEGLLLKDSLDRQN